MTMEECWKAKKAGTPLVVDTMPIDLFYAVCPSSVYRSSWEVQYQSGRAGVKGIGTIRPATPHELLTIPDDQTPEERYASALAHSRRAPPHEMRLATAAEILVGDDA